MAEMVCVVCGALGPHKFSRQASNWDWFSGYLPETVHFCPEHKGNDECERLRALSLRPKPKPTHALATQDARTEVGEKNL